MNLFLRLASVFLLCPVFSFAQDNPDYAYKNIPPELLAHANTVMRTYEERIDIVSPEEVYIKEHYAITVLNENGNSDANHAEYCSSLNSIESISGCLYDANGVKVKKIKQSDFVELPASMRAGEFSDAKFKAYHLSYGQYPYTIEYTIETKQNHSFHIPQWMPQVNKQCAVESALLLVTTQGSMNLKYKSFNIDSEPVISQAAEKRYKWTLKNVRAEKKEPMRFTGVYTTPVVLLAVDDFMLGNFKGSTNSWKDFGAFVFHLNEGRDKLPPEVKNKVQQLVAGISDDREKIRILYAYMQTIMRYVSVTYGIGGWQTLDAEFLSKNQYGDCKALSNYMMAMLSEVGIRSYPVLITAGSENPRVLNTGFVCSQFNHCILCVPFAKDTTWLECTSSDLPPNYLSDFTQDRDALMITPAGGFLVHTPRYDTSVNLVVRHANISCNDDGSLSIRMSSTYTGEGASHLYGQLKHENDHDREEFLRSKFRLGSYSLVDYKYEQIERAPVMCLQENATLRATGLLTKTGNRSFITLNIAPISIAGHVEDEDRKDPFHIPESNAATDTFELTLPANTDVEFIPQPVAARYPFGSYFYSIAPNGNKLIVICKFTINGGTYPAEQYNNYVKFAGLIENNTHKKVVLKARS